jgi:hypothetical protein
VRITYARLEEIHPDAIAGFRATFAAEQETATRFAEKLTEKGRSAFIEQAASEEFRLLAFDRWMKSEGRKFIATTRPDRKDDALESETAAQKAVTERAA